MLVICVCYFLRFAYDVALLFLSKWFPAMRRREAEEGQRIYYSLFLFCLLIIVELCPITMFALNLKWVFHHQAEIKPKSPMVGQAIIFEKGRRDTGKPLFAKTDAYRESLLSEAG